jgi:hypothetical protein
MRDYWHSFMKFLDYERGKVLGAIAAIALIGSMVGCEVAVPSPLSNSKVTRIQFTSEVTQAQTDLTTTKAKLDAQVAAYNAQVELLQKQIAAAEDAFGKAEQFRADLIEIAGGVATSLTAGTPIGWPAIIASLVGTMGVLGTAGGLYDSNRKNRIIAEAKTQ